MGASVLAKGAAKSGLEFPLKAKDESVPNTLVIYSGGYIPEFVFELFELDLKKNSEESKYNRGQEAILAPNKRCL